jgi:2-polyprenyl-3-methyl-5-hydroxy-6-metoxy-1,4-benzoquinol methylase
MLKLVKIVCPLCGYLEFTNVAVRFDKLNIVRCKRCKVAYVNPRPTAEDIAKMYKENYYIGGEDTAIGYGNYFPSVVNIKCYPPYGWELLLEETSLANKRTLDIGCAFGHWVYWMTKEGAKATGIDLAPEAIKWGRGKFGLDMRQSTLESLEEPKESFDVITMFDLIEHIIELEKFMTDLVSFLKPGGLVFVQTPNFGSYQTWGERSIHMRFSLEHMLYFEVASLDQLFSKYGMLPTRETRVLYNIPCNVESYVNVRKAECGRFGARIRQLHSFEFLRLVRSKLLRFKHVYRYDESKQEGSTIIGSYSKQVS